MENKYEAEDEELLSLYAKSRRIDERILKTGLWLLQQS